MNYQRQFTISLAMLIGLLFTGTLGYLVIEKNNPEGSWRLLDAIYMTVITLTTVGYENLAMSDNGRVFTVLLLVSGIGVFTYSVSIATSFLIEGQMQNIFRKQKMTRTIDKLSNHYIICGLGDAGMHVLDEMLKEDADFVCIERDEERLNALSERQAFSYLLGDATDDEVLRRAGIARASGLITCLGSDEANLFIVLSARKLNPNLRIVAKAVGNTSPEKLLIAGADEVVSTDHIGGLRLAAGLLRPQLIDFLMNLTQENTDVQFHECIIEKDSPLDGVLLKDTNLQEKTGLVVIAIRTADDTFFYNITGDETIVAGDAVIAIATQKQLEKLQKLTGNR